MDLRDILALHRYRDDPIGLAESLWPHARFYAKQRECIESVRDNDETFIVAGNMLGKDYQAGFICLWFFLTRHPCRIVTTSVKDDHLRVLWGEIGRFISTCKIPLDEREGGILLINHRDIRKSVNNRKCDISYLVGMVSKSGEGMAGHHAANTLGVIDEASGVDDLVYTQMDTWAKRKLVFGNPMNTTNFFYRAVKSGNLQEKEAVNG